MYLTYEEYTSMGGTLTETQFDDYEFSAENEVNWYTFNRLSKVTEYPEALKRCMFQLIKILQAVDVVGTQAVIDPSTSNKAVTSQSNDGVSISYNVTSASDIVSQSQTNIKNCINKYLQGVTDSLGRNLLYRGLYPNE